jgi:peptidoglycan/xylan/chitin deacetylase (PgdA/CDA1 family)
VAPARQWAELPNRDFYIDLDFLDQLLRHLKRTGCSVVTVTEMLDVMRKGGSKARLVNISIDDCYRDTYELLVPLFRSHGLPVTLYVTTGIPDGTHLMPWVGLEHILATREHVQEGGEAIPLPTAERRRAAFAMLWQTWESTGDLPAQYLAFCAANGADPWALVAHDRITWDMLRDLAQDPRVEIGAHTVNHPRISALDAATAQAEIVGSAERLVQVLGQPVAHFAFPYGRSGDCGTRDYAIARDGGLRSAATTRKGLCGPASDPFSLPRNTLNGRHKSLAMAEASMSGLTGIAARLMRRV